MGKCKPTASELLERDFVKNRSRVLEVAAFLDRIDRFEGSAEARQDFRYRALARALQVLASARPNKVREILLLLSDPTLLPVEDAVPPQRAQGAWEDVNGAY